ncbi:hypothetical protein SK128_003783 [Halocaridina rubra]|uniref:Uncharacterized protein n=1 Tax=Halocaridina rubra TaxID=373956 RepID=A0AAN8WUN6_HALRR
MDDISAAHQIINDIILEKYPDDSLDEDCTISVRSSFHSLNNSNQVVTDSLESGLQLASVRQDLACLTKKIDSAKLSEASSELTHPDIINKHIAWSEEAGKHLQSISENNDLLTNHLQQPFVVNYLTMHFQYHRKLITLVEELQNILSNSEEYTELVRNHANNSILQILDSFINNTAKSMAEIRNTIDGIVSLQTVIQETSSCRTPDSSSVP